jgi:uncharacterized protein
MQIGLLTLFIHIPGCKSLKEKRSRIKPLISRLHREFNISVAEVENLDSWHESTIACSIVSNENGFNQRGLQKVVDYCENYFPDLPIVNHRIEII